ncbi:MAG: flippase-like domain-containing protein [Candidatus Promineifilaceae bacterium]|nr:flippase-like domain-containing protein [Candidatus Promineifilaceae bacterium]
MSVRRVLLWLLLAAFGWLVISRLQELEDLAETLYRGVWRWAIVAALLQIAYHVLQARVYQIAFALVGVRSRLRQLVPVLLGSVFVNAVAPAVGTAGMALFVDDAVQRGESGPRTTTGALMATIGLYAGFGLVLIGALIYLQMEGALRLYELATAGVLLLFTLLLTIWVLLGWLRPLWLRRLLDLIQRMVNGLARRIRRPPPLPPAWSQQTAAEFTEASRAIRRRPRGLGPILLWALVAHLINAASLYAVFRAFRTPVAVGPLLAGYAIGQMFVIIAPTPQGVGFVETLTPFVFARFGVAGAVATIVVLAYRGLSFWLPLLVGFFMVQRLKSLGARERALTEVWSVRFVALLAALLGLINVVTALLPGLALELQPVTRYAPLQVGRGRVMGATLSGFALLLLARALWRRKWTAWVLTLLVLFVFLGSALFEGRLLDLRVLIAFALALWLLTLGPHFHARSDPPSVRQGMQVLALALAFVLIFGAVGMYLLALDADRPMTGPAAVGQTVVMLLAMRPPEWLLRTESGPFLTVSIYTISGVTLLYALLLLARPVLLRRSASPAERARARAIVRRHRSGPLGRMALQPERAYFFSPGGSLVAFQVTGRTAVALGDPIGPPEDMARTVERFTRQCKANDWLPAFYHVRARHKLCYEQAGFNLLAVAREGVVELGEGPAEAVIPARVRARVERLLEKGYRARCILPPHSPLFVEQLELISDEWLTGMHAQEPDFPLEWFDHDFVARTPVVFAETPDGTPGAFATVVLGWQPIGDGAACGGQAQGQQAFVDLLRRRPWLDASLLDLVLFRAIVWSAAEGADSVSLGATALEERPRSATATVLSYIYRNPDAGADADDAGQTRMRFEPHWCPRYLAYPGTANLPAVWSALHRIRGISGWPVHAGPPV